MNAVLTTRIDCYIGLNYAYFFRWFFLFGNHGKKFHKKGIKYDLFFLSELGGSFY